MSEKKQYIGKKQVIGFVIQEEFKTPMGGEIVEVLYLDSNKELMPKKTFNLIVTDKESNDSEVAKTKFRPMVQEILAVVADYDIKFFELEYLTTMIKNSILENINRANNYLWRKDDASHIAGYDMLNDITFLDVQNILKQIPKKNEPTGK